jgi:hypothetical protein
MLENKKVLKFLEHFSIITVAENKVPNFSWKKCQTEKLTPEQLIKQLEYKGGHIKKDGREMPGTDNFGIVTGFQDLEVIDVDLKVFSTAKEQKEFWDEFSGYLDDNILDFKDKFAVYKTKNAGYHILYKTKRVEGNLKLAALKGHKEAVIETRGIGGYVFAYPENKVFKKSYFDIDYISDDDREILFSFARMYNFVDEKPIEPEKKKNEYEPGEITCWDDYNNKHSVFDVISDEFSIVANLSKKYIIKRHGADSAHSGYVFKDNGCMYLHSTGTLYPHEKQISAFVAYSYKYHQGDLSDAAKELYQKGYGSRLKKKVQENEKKVPKNESLLENYSINKNDLVFPIDIFPKPIQSYLMECNTTLDSNVDYMGVSLLWLVSVCIGNSIEIEVKRGWRENCSLWVAVVGKAGIGKTPSINNVIFPIQKINSREIKKYIQEIEKYNFYNNLTKKEKEDYPEVEKPVKKQFIANDITLEALVDLHQESDNAVGVFKDELAGWLKDMNKYREGSDLEFWLSVWSGKSVNLNRLTRPGSFVDKPFIPVLGGIQPGILNGFYTEENKDNGFMDRMLLSFPEAIVDTYNDREMPYEVLEWYKEVIISFFDTLKRKVNRNLEGEIEPIVAHFDDDARKEWKRIFNEITHYQNDEDENEYLKSMYPKQKSYIPRFALLIHVFNAFFDSSNIKVDEISKESILKAERLSKYFIATAKKIKFNSVEVNQYKTILNENKKKSTREKIKEIYNNNTNFNRTEIAEMLGVSRQIVIKYANEAAEAGVNKV